MKGLRGKDRFPVYGLQGENNGSRLGGRLREKGARVKAQGFERVKIRFAVYGFRVQGQGLSLAVSGEAGSVRVSVLESRRKIGLSEVFSLE